MRFIVFAFILTTIVNIVMFSIAINGLYMARTEFKNNARAISKEVDRQSIQILLIKTQLDIDTSHVRDYDDAWYMISGIKNGMWYRQDGEVKHE